MITVRCPVCREWSRTAAFGNGLLDALQEHQQNCPDEWGINFLKEKTR